ncbi:MAG: hypothetical protein Q7S40_28445 [Opitutaceae bacterium]|nr:hypothetical protein [Opitutaceae bacterium]
MKRAPVKILHLPVLGTEPLRLRAGPLQLRFEPALLWARYWTCHHVEVLRAVYLAVRDTRWNTPQPRVRWRRSEIHPDRFTLKLKARYGGRRPFFEWDLRLDGSADGRVVYAARGVALDTFRTNRTGFSVLHPAEAAGRRCRIEHADGTSENGAFPREISPHQPFFDVRAIKHSPAPGMRVEVRMHGETFEMEDQRNWTDASFKTYCRPLQRTWPFVVRRGATIKQRIEVRVSERRIRHRAVPSAVDCFLTLDRKLTRMPALGALRREGAPLSTIAANLLRTAGIKHLRVDLDTTSAACLAQWTSAAADAVKVGADVALEVVLKVGANERPLENLARHIAATQPPSATRWVILDRETKVTSGAVFGRVATLWARHRINGLLGGGVGGEFVDLNRSCPLEAASEFVCFGVDAQVHAFDETSILETLSTYPTVIARARRLSGGLPVAVSPVRFGMPRTGKPQRDDPRQRTTFGGVWMLASLAALARGKANSATFELPRLDNATPALQVLQACAATGSDHVLLVASSEPHHACAIGLRTSAGFLVLIANLRGEDQRVRMNGLPRSDCRVTLLSSNCTASLTRAMPANAALTLPPYAVLQIDVSSAT